MLGRKSWRDLRGWRLDDWFEKDSALYSPVRMLHGVMRKHPTDKYDCKAVSQSAYAAMRKA